MRIIKTKFILPVILSALAALAVYSLGGRTKSIENGAIVSAVTDNIHATDLYFKKSKGRIEEHSLREANSATHIYLDSSKDPYLFFAFPAGNSGVALWLQSDTPSANLTATARPNAIVGENGLIGASVDLKAGVKSLRVKDWVLGSMRFIRDRELDVAIPAAVRTASLKVTERSFVIDRTSISRVAKYQLVVEALGDTRLVQLGDVLSLESPTDVHFRMKGFSSETPLTPLPAEQIFSKQALASMDRDQLQAFSFLLYKEKLMAGSPRYFTKFGRDSLFTLHALMEDLRPEAIESLLSATLSSVHPEKGTVSHEQHEGDFASFERLRQGQPYIGVTDPIEDYKMIDGDFALTIVLSQYMRLFPERTKAFLDGVEQRGHSRRLLVQRNFTHTIDAAAPFAAHPIFTNLVQLTKGERVGNWRDSDNGLGGGIYPFDVNVALLPGAIKALAELHASQESEYHDELKAANLARIFAVWNSQALPLFLVRQNDMEFSAISLDRSGRPVPIMHSDDSFVMTFGYPTEQYLTKIVQRIQRPYPRGLWTSAGILVANPAFAPSSLKRQFSADKYHGFVSWIMQEDMLAIGLDRQLKRTDLSQQVKIDLQKCKEVVEGVLRAKSADAGGEVFSIVARNGTYVAEPFAGDAKTNSNQLWSYLRITTRHRATAGDELQRSSGTTGTR